MNLWKQTAKQKMKLKEHEEVLLLYVDRFSKYIYILLCFIWIYLIEP